MRAETSGYFIALRKIGFCAALIWSFLQFANCQSAIGSFRHFEVDPSTLKAQWSGPILEFGQDGRIFYQVWPNQRNRHIVNELVWPIGSSQQPSYNSLMLDAQNRIMTRSKYQELLSGAYGSVYAETNYHYSEDYKSSKWATAFTTFLYRRDVAHEPFALVALLPTENLELSAISVVRILKNGTNFVVASANYAHDGHLESVSLYGATNNGEWQQAPPDLPQALAGKFGTLIGEHAKTRQALGLPKTFPISAYIKSPVSVFSAACLPSILDVVNLHYNRNRWVRQDSYETGKSKTRFLSFEFTSVDRALDTIDRRRLFGEYSYTRDPAWEHSD